MTLPAARSGRLGTDAICPLARRKADHDDVAEYAGTHAWISDTTEVATWREKRRRYVERVDRRWPYISPNGE